MGGRDRREMKIIRQGRGGNIKSKEYFMKCFACPTSFLTQAAYLLLPFTDPSPKLLLQSLQQVS